MWTDENRAKYNRDHLRYPSDVTEEEWGLVAPLIPRAKRGGRKRTTDMRETFNAVMYMLSTGCQQRYIPKHFPQGFSPSIFRHIRRFAAISTHGAGMACSTAFTRFST